MGDLVEVKVSEIPMCDLHKTAHVLDVPAEYDGKTIMGPWAYMCADHFRDYGVGLGMGRGQRLILRGE